MSKKDKVSVDNPEKDKVTELEISEEEMSAEVEEIVEAEDIPENTAEKTAEDTSADENVVGSEEADSFNAVLTDSIQKIKCFKKSAVEFLDKLGIPNMVLVRFIAAFFMISAFNINSIKGKTSGGIEINPVTMWKDFVPLVNGVLTILLMLSLFIVLSLIHYVLPKKFQIIDQCSAIAAVLCFDIVLLWRNADFNLSFGVMMVSTVLVYYSYSKIKSKKLLNKIPWWVIGIIILVMAAAVAAFVSITTICGHRCFGTNCYDLGIFVQMYHSLAKYGTAVTTCERDAVMSHFRIHASYIFYALAPIYKMFPKAETLLIAQAVLSMGGVIPMFLIAKRRNFKGITLLFMGLAYVFCIGIVAPCYYEFHENAFLPTVLMWLMWAVDRKNYIMFYVMSVLTCIVKEDAPLYVVCIGLYLFFEDKGRLRRMNGLIMSLFAGAYMMFITNWLTKNGDGQMMMNSRFSILMIDSTAGLKEVVKNALADPAYLFSLLVRDDTIRCFLQVMIPFLFIPFFTKKIHRFLLMMPFVVMNLVIGAGYGYAANVGFQYIFGPICLLLYMCIINIDDMGQNGKQNIPVALGTAAIIMTMSNCSHRWGNYDGYLNDKEYFDNLEELLCSIPEDASVGTDSFLIPHAANRDEVYIFDIYDYNDENVIFTPERFDFVALPVRNDTFERSAEVLTINGYTLWAEIPGKAAVFKSASYVSEE